MNNAMNPPRFWVSALWLGLCTALCAQSEAAATRPDTELATAHEAWQAKWQAFVAASMEARKAGRIPKGALLPEDVQKLQDAADADSLALLARFGGREGLEANSYLLLARLQETNRQYRAAVDLYAKALARGKPQAPDTATMHSLCIAAMNSKDDQLAARWMHELVEYEDRAKPAQRQLSVRTSYYPRTLISLHDWKGLDALVESLAKDTELSCRIAATKFGIVSRLNKGDVGGAEQAVAAVMADQKTYADDQAWAMSVHLALLVHRGKFTAAADALREFLAAKRPEGSPESAVDANQRRCLAAVAPFLCKPAPVLRIDRWVGGAIAGDDVWKALAGKVVLLDFWQPWCEPCRNAMPHLVALQKKHAEDIQVLGLCKVENYGYDVSEKKAVRPLTPEQYPAHVEDFRNDMQLNYPLAIADTGANGEAYKIMGIPTLVIVDRHGIVRYMSCGAGEPGLLEIAVAGVLAAK